MSHEGKTDNPTKAGVGDILQAVETQLEQLRTVQQSQEEDSRALAEREQALARKEQAIIERRKAVDAHMDKLRKEQAALKTERTVFKREMSEWNETQTKRQDSERDRETQREMLERELAERREGLDVAASSIESLSGRVAELEKELNTAHARADEVTNESLELLKAAEEEREAVRAQLDELRARDVGDNEAAQNLQAQLEAAHKRLEEREVAIAEQDERLKTLEATIAEQDERLKTHEATIAEQDERLKTHEATIAEKDERLKTANEATDASGRECIDELERALEAKRTELTEAQSKVAELEAAVREAGDAGAVDEEQLDDLRNKAQRLAQVADHMRRRQTRLKRARDLIRRKRSGARGQAAIESERRTALTKHLERQRRELLELKQHLALAERKMIRRWARPRSIMTIGWFLMLVLFSAAVGWFGADRYFPAVVSASVQIEIDDAFSGTVDETVEKQWKAWHVAFVEDPVFIDVLAKRLNERQIVEYGSPDAVRDRLLRDLGIDEVEEGVITYTLAGSDRNTMLTFMDLFAATLARRSAKTHRGTEMPWASVRNDRAKTGEAFTAQIGPVPIKDERLRYAGPIAGIVFAMLLMCIGIAYSKLVRAKREFDDSGDLFEALAEGQFAMPS